MANRVGNTYAKLSGTLQSLGFQSSRQGNHVVFTHSSGRPMILLPPYKSGQAVAPIHLMMVKKQLTDVGLITPGELAVRLHAAPSTRRKP